MKTVLITGASSGIGKATAIKLHEKGWKVYGTSRSIKQDQFPFSVMEMDITDQESIKRGVDKVLTNEGKIDALINCAGYGIAGAFEETLIGEAKAMFNTNFFGSVSITQEVLKLMRAKKSGTIVNISSIGGLMGLPFQSFYSATKYAIEGVSEALSMELAPWNIKVIVIQPGDVSSEFTQNRMLTKGTGTSSEYKNQFQKTLRTIETDEKTGISVEKVAEKIAYSLNTRSPRFRYIPSSAEQRLAVTLKKMVPFSIFRKLLKNHYQIG